MFAHLIVENFHPAAGLIQEPENLVLDIEEMLLVRGDASHKVMVALFELWLLQCHYLSAPNRLSVPSFRVILKERKKALSTPVLVECKPI